MDLLSDYLVNIIEVVAIILGGFLAFLAAKAHQVLKSKLSAEQYNLAVKVAEGLYLTLEDEFRDVKKAGEKKAQEMYSRLRELFPALSQVELESINKWVWDEFNVKYPQYIEIEDVTLADALGDGVSDEDGSGDEKASEGSDDGGSDSDESLEVLNEDK